METSALKRPQESISPASCKEILPPVRPNRQSKPQARYPQPICREPGRGTLICRISSSFEFNFDTRVSLDFLMRYKIPHGTGIRQTVPATLRQKTPNLHEEIVHLSSSLLNQSPELHLLSLGTLGGGRNFIEIAQSGNHHYLIVHTDARTLGQEIKKVLLARQEEQAHIASSLNSVSPKTLEQALLTARAVGQWNRRMIAHELLGDLCEEMTDTLQENEEIPPTQNLTSLYRFQVP